MVKFQRKILQKFQAWKSAVRRAPLLILGARQVGKSFIVREFGNANYTQTIEINFEQTPAFKKIFVPDLVPQRIIAEIELLKGVRINPERDLIFFDEIQECPEAIVALRYFYEQAPQYQIIAAGNLLEFALETISMPVGRVQSEYLYPLSFCEFLAAIGKDHLIQHIPKLQDKNPKPLNENAMTLIYQHLREYFIVGGMPAVIAVYIESKESFVAAAEMQDRILRGFKDDIHKYAKGNLLIQNLERILESSIKHVGKQVKYSTISPDDDYKRTKKSLDLLEKAMLITKVPTVNPSGLPLGAEASEKYFKIVFLDIGLGQRWSGFRSAEIISEEKLLEIYEGKLAEQFVGQQLLAESSSASEDRSLYCWIRAEKASQAEVDYIVVRNAKIIPVEVKSSKSGHLKSLKVFKQKYPDTGQAVCLQHRNDMDLQQEILFMPLFSIL